MVTRHLQGLQFKSTAYLNRLGCARLSVTELEVVWQWLHHCLSWSQGPVFSLIGVAVLKVLDTARNTAVLPAVVGTIAVTCAAASGFTGGLIGLKNLGAEAQGIEADMLSSETRLWSASMK